MKGFEEPRNIKQTLQLILIGLVVVIFVAIIVYALQKRPSVTTSSQERQQTASPKTAEPSKIERKETMEPSKAKEGAPTSGEISKGPSYAAPSYKTPGAKTPGFYHGQTQKMEPSVPGSVEKKSPGETLTSRDSEAKALPLAKSPSVTTGNLSQQEGKSHPSPGLGILHGMEEKEHVSLPEISPIPGVTFVEVMIKLMEQELKERFLGWRPNDIIIGRFTDNMNNYQLGVLEAMRFTTLRLKDSLTRMGEADAYDRDLQDALNLFMNKATQFWFPSAETSYSEAVEHLKRFLEKLKKGERKFYYRIDTLLSLVASYNDLIGNVNRTLIMDKRMDGKPVSFFETDDYFYYAKGVAHVMFEVLKVVRVGFHEQLTTINATEIMDEILHELHRAEKMEPWIILNADLDGIFANHRANLNAPLSEVAHLMTVMSRF